MYVYQKFKRLVAFKGGFCLLKVTSFSQDLFSKRIYLCEGPQLYAYVTLLMIDSFFTLLKRSNQCRLSPGRGSSTSTLYLASLNVLSPTVISFVRLVLQNKNSFSMYSILSSMNFLSLNACNKEMWFQALCISKDSLIYH